MQDCLYPLFFFVFRILLPPLDINALLTVSVDSDLQVTINYFTVIIFIVTLTRPIPNFERLPYMERTAYDYYEFVEIGYTSFLFMLCKFGRVQAMSFMNLTWLGRAKVLDYAEFDLFQILQNGNFDIPLYLLMM